MFTTNIGFELIFNTIETAIILLILNGSVDGSQQYIRGYNDGYRDAIRGLDNRFADKRQAMLRYTQPDYGIATQWPHN